MWFWSTNLQTDCKTTLRFDLLVVVWFCSYCLCLMCLRSLSLWFLGLSSLLKSSETEGLLPSNSRASHTPSNLEPPCSEDPVLILVLDLGSEHFDLSGADVQVLDFMWCPGPAVQVREFRSWYLVCCSITDFLILEFRSWNSGLGFRVRCLKPVLRSWSFTLWCSGFGPAPVIQVLEFRSWQSSQCWDSGYRVLVFCSLYSVFSVQLLELDLQDWDLESRSWIS